ncbi:MAG: transmembrane 220 family protein [Quisquiliibacterium sp.]
MRAIYIVCSLLMLAFVGVQYNDPDWLMWGLIYLIPAVWAGLAAFRRELLKTASANRLLWVTVATGLAGVIAYWPSVDHWWVKEVWWKEETAREGMGMMMVFAVLLLVALTNRTGKPAQA